MYFFNEQNYMKANLLHLDCPPVFKRRVDSSNLIEKAQKSLSSDLIAKTIVV